MLAMEYDVEYDVEFDRKAVFEEGLRLGFEICRKQGLELDKDFVQGFVQGFAKGFVEGFAKGMIKGKIIVTKNLLKINTPIEYIIQATGWSEDKIRNLADNGGK